MKKILALVLLLTFSVQQTRSCPPCAVVLAYFAGISTETVIVSGLAAGVTTANVVYFAENGPLFRPITTDHWNPNELPNNPGGPNWEWASKDCFLQMLVGTIIIDRLINAPSEFKERKEFLEKAYKEDPSFHDDVESLATQLVKNGFLVIPVQTNMGTASRVLVQGYSWNPNAPAFNQYDEVTDSWSYISYTENGWTTSLVNETGNLRKYEKLAPKGPGTFAWNRGLQYVRNTSNPNVIKSFLAGDCQGDPGCEVLKGEFKSIYDPERTEEIKSAVITDDEAFLLEVSLHPEMLDVQELRDRFLSIFADLPENAYKEKLRKFFCDRFPGSNFAICKGGSMAITSSVETRIEVEEANPDNTSLPKKRGRPIGSKNRPKPDEVVATEAVEVADQQAASDEKGLLAIDEVTALMENPETTIPDPELANQMQELKKDVETADTKYQEGDIDWNQYAWRLKRLGKRAISLMERYQALPEDPAILADQTPGIVETVTETDVISETFDKIVEAKEAKEEALEDAFLRGEISASEHDSLVQIVRNEAEYLVDNIEVDALLQRINEFIEGESVNFVPAVSNSPENATANPDDSNPELNEAVDAMQNFQAEVEKLVEDYRTGKILRKEYKKKLLPLEEKLRRLKEKFKSYVQSNYDLPEKQSAKTDSSWADDVLKWISGNGPRPNLKKGVKTYKDSGRRMRDLMEKAFGGKTGG